MSNSNFNITKVTVDPTSQEITNLEINGKAFESGGEVNLETREYDVNNKLNVETIFWDRTIPILISPSSGYDGLESVTIQPGGLTGYPGEGLETWYVGSGDYDGRINVPLAINGNPYDANPDITHFIVPFNPNDEGDEMNWKKYEAYDVEVEEDTCGGMRVSFYTDEEKTNQVYMYTNEQEGAMAKVYISSSDITNA